MSAMGIRWRSTPARSAVLCSTRHHGRRAPYLHTIALGSQIMSIMMRLPLACQFAGFDSRFGGEIGCEHAIGGDGSGSRIRRKQNHRISAASRTARGFAYRLYRHVGYVGVARAYPYSIGRGIIWKGYLPIRYTYGFGQCRSACSRHTEKSSKAKRKRVGSGQQKAKRFAQLFRYYFGSQRSSLAWRLICRPSKILRNWRQNVAETARQKACCRISKTTKRRQPH